MGETWISSTQGQREARPSHQPPGQWWDLGSRGSEWTEGLWWVRVSGRYLLEGAAYTLTTVQVVAGHLCKAMTLVTGSSKGPNPSTILSG